MAYASVQDLRDEGVLASAASDERLVALLTEASAFVDRVTGWYFDVREATYRLDGRGTPTLEPPVPSIRLGILAVNGVPLPTGPDDMVIVGAPVTAGFDAPRFTRRHGQVFPKGQGNVTAQGLWGLTEPDGTPFGRTPLAVRRATMRLVMRLLPPLAASDGSSANAWRIIEERTRDQSYKLASPITQSALFTGDPEIDMILARYRKPMGMGAA